MTARKQKPPVKTAHQKRISEAMRMLWRGRWKHRRVEARRQRRTGQ